MVDLSKSVLAHLVRPNILEQTYERERENQRQTKVYQLQTAERFVGHLLAQAIVAQIAQYMVVTQARTV